MSDVGTQRRYMERRFAPMDPDSVEVREDKTSLRYRGHGSVFNQEADFGFMREVVRPGAFSKTIQEGDIRFLYNHNPDTVMARTTLGTLRLSEDDDGLFTEADLDPSDLDVQRLVPKLRSGNINQMSIGFTAVRDEFHKGSKDEAPLRELREMKLFDVSPVTFPAFENATGSLRSAFEEIQKSVQIMGLPLDFGPAQTRTANDLIDELVSIDDLEADPERVRGAIAALSALLEREAAPPSEEEHSEDRSLPPLEHFKRVLELQRNLQVA